MAQFTINALRFDPYKNFKFRVKWDGRYVAGISKVSALKRSTEVVEHREGGDPSTSRKSPGRTKYDPVTLERAWSAIAGPQGQPYLRMFSRLHDTGGEPLWPGFRRAATTDWLAPIERGMRTIGRPELATVVLAVIRGLLMDLDATGDAERTDRAFRDCVATIHPR